MIGRAFSEAGVKHVVCIGQQHEVLDQAALLFTKFFYKSILNQSTICDAFKSTKNFVKNQYKNYESDRFTLLTNDCSPSCSYINKKSKEKGGQFMCLSDHVQVKSVPIMAKSETYKEVKDSHTQKVFNREKML